MFWIHFIPFEGLEKYIMVKIVYVFLSFLGWRYLLFSLRTNPKPVKISPHQFEWRVSIYKKKTVKKLLNCFSLELNEKVAHLKDTEKNLRATNGIVLFSLALEI